MKPSQFAYHVPKTLPEAVQLMAELAAEDGRVIAGGQTLVPMMAYRLARPQHLVDINRIPGLDAITFTGGKLRIGATVRHSMLERNTSPDTLAGFLARIAHHIAHPPIRSRGTFCGSVANSDPASEWCLLSVTMDADIIAHSSRGVRSLPAGSFFFGTMVNALAPDEIVAEVHIPALPDGARCGFYEVSRVSGGFALAAAVVIYRVDEGRVADARIGIGGVEASPRRIPEAESELQGMDPKHIDIKRITEAAAQAVDTADDSPAGDAFKRQLVRTVVARALEQTLHGR